MKWMNLYPQVQYYKTLHMLHFKCYVQHNIYNLVSFGTRKNVLQDSISLIGTMVDYGLE